MNRPWNFTLHNVAVQPVFKIKIELSNFIILINRIYFIFFILEIN